jgi:hypothetical protein
MTVPASRLRIQELQREIQALQERIARMEGAGSPL